MILVVLNKPGPAISVLSINSLFGMFWTIFSAISLGLTFCPLAFIILKTHIYKNNPKTKETSHINILQNFFL